MYVVFKSVPTIRVAFLQLLLMSYHSHTVITLRDNSNQLNTAQRNLLNAFRTIISRQGKIIKVWSLLVEPPLIIVTTMLDKINQINSSSK